MNDDSTERNTEAVAAELRESRLVYGAMLVGEQLNLVECIDENAFTDNSAQTALYTAFNNIGANLVPIVAEAEGNPDEELPVTASPYQDDSFETPRLTTFDRVADLLPEARAYYFLLNKDEDEWKRVQNTIPEKFAEGEPLSEPFLGRYVVASVLVDEAGDRFAEFPESVDPEAIELIDWGG